MNGASSIHLSIFGMHPVVRHGSAELRQRYLPRVAAGDLHVAFGVTEPDAGLDTTAIRTHAVPDGAGYRITGRKVWTSKALESERVLLLTRTTPVGECAKRTDGLTLFVAPLQDPAVTVRPIPKLGRNAVASCEVAYDGLYVDARDRVGEEGRGRRRRGGRADPRWVRLRHRVPRRALLARSPAAQDRPDPAGDDPELPGRARPRPAQVVLGGLMTSREEPDSVEWMRRRWLEQ